MNTQKQIVLMVALMFLLVGGCAAYTAIELPVRAPDQADWTRDQSLERGALLFANNCRTCHGNRGDGSIGPQLLNNETHTIPGPGPAEAGCEPDSPSAHVELRSRGYAHACMADGQRRLAQRYPDRAHR
ncbi:MAG: hypothetical protein IPO51_01740 [Dehalococcoidia bacterium]|nr:hypothetical protein [Dehalococcoidia bacterium]